MIERENIIQALADGHSAKEVAKRFDLPVREVLDILRDNDPQSAVVFLKASERRANLSGANAPTSHAIHVMNTAPIEHKTSTDRIRDAIDNVMGVTEREKELRAKAEVLAGAPGLTSEEEAEYKALQDEREARRNAKAPTTQAQTH